MRRINSTVFYLTLLLNNINIPKVWSLSLYDQEFFKIQGCRKSEYIVVFQPPFLPVLTVSNLVLVVRNLYNQTRPARQSPVEVSRPRNRQVLNV